MGRTLYIPRPRFVILAVLVMFWLGLSGLLLVSQGNPESFLSSNFGRNNHADTFEHLNGALFVFWLVHTGWTLVTIAAIRARRFDVMAVLLLGPAVCLGIGLVSQSWSDPNWFILVAVCTIGWLVGTVVVGGYWALRSLSRFRHRNDAIPA